MTSCAQRLRFQPTQTKLPRTVLFSLVVGCIILWYKGARFCPEHCPVSEHGTHSLGWEVLLIVPVVYTVESMLWFCAESCLISHCCSMMTWSTGPVTLVSQPNLIGFIVMLCHHIVTQFSIDHHSTHCWKVFYGTFSAVASSRTRVLLAAPVHRSGLSWSELSSQHSGPSMTFKDWN